MKRLRDLDWVPARVPITATLPAFHSPAPPILVGGSTHQTHTAIFIIITVALFLALLGVSLAELLSTQEHLQEVRVGSFFCSMTFAVLHTAAAIQMLLTNEDKGCLGVPERFYMSAATLSAFLVISWLACVFTHALGAAVLVGLTAMTCRVGLGLHLYLAGPLSPTRILLEAATALSTVAIALTPTFFVQN